MPKKSFQEYYVTNTLAVTNSYAQSLPAYPDKADFYVRISNPLDVRGGIREG